ncbi:heterokaryon incompatibility protein-domain-containing protein [Clohesyomyces aquaticus]|uniref:Heterokaryon incompatibility protein-domain-containing protein n=1 Tax=Clohesyomyces aquaticus TaxID=1231657 RepID=A0A1Y1ZJ47_9PLEO|nr:heterokaryon incompatibility protein-domain-containing protein [Clohesyomyces aquaticus]
MGSDVPEKSDAVRFCEEYIRARRDYLCSESRWLDDECAWPLTTPHRCKYCETTFTFEADSRELLPYKSSSAAFPLHQAVEAAQKGCAFNSWLLDTICSGQEDSEIISFDSSSHLHANLELVQVYDSEIVPRGANQDEIRRLKWDGKSRIRSDRMEPLLRYKYQSASAPYELRITVKVDTSNGPLESLQTLSFWSDSADIELSKSTIARTPMIEGDKASPKSLRFASNRLSACLTSHPFCRPSLDSGNDCGIYMPTRVLEVLPLSKTVRLVNSASLFQSKIDRSSKATNLGYCVLSYCWGKTQPMILTKETSGTLMEGVHIPDLAKTIWDAVLVCKQLNVQYLWVDALCIFQDDGADQAKEIAKMAEYYQNGILTISAACAKSCTDGFLSSFDPEFSVGPFDLEFEEGPRKLPEPEWTYADRAMKQDNPDTYWQNSPYTSRELEAATARPTRIRVQLGRLKEEESEPITLRAWTFQEALLSKRILIFGYRQVYWCCRDSYVGCGGTDSFDRSEIVHRDCGAQEDICVCGISLVRDIKQPDRVPHIFTLGNRHTMSTDAQWDMVVESYSGRMLTLEVDKLPALAAAAYYFDTIFKARWPDVQYVCGLWFSPSNPLSFIRQLLWTWNQEDFGMPQKRSDTKIPEQRELSTVAPSWSWAGQNGKVKQMDRMAMNYYHFHVDLKVTSIFITLDNPRLPFGRITAAQLIVRGRIQVSKEASAMFAMGDLRIRKICKSIMLIPDAVAPHPKLRYSDVTVSLLEVISYTERKPSPVGLILAPVHEGLSTALDHRHVFRRLGVFIGADNAHPEGCSTFFNSSKEQEIYII